MECRRVDTPFGEKWLVTPESVERHIAYIREVTPTTGHDLSRLDTTGRDRDETVSPANDTAIASPKEVPQAPTGTDTSRPVATSTDNDRYLTRLESENDFLRGQIAVKDGQIRELTERARETNVLIGGLQKMLSPLLGAPARSRESTDDARPPQAVDRGARS